MTSEEQFQHSKGNNFEFYGDLARLLREFSDLENKSLIEHIDHISGLIATDDLSITPEGNKGKFFIIQFKSKWKIKM